MKKNIVRLTEAELHQVIAESVRSILRESEGYFVMEDGVLLQDQSFFGDNEEHEYNVKCYDGYGIGVLADEDGSNAPRTVRLEYPTMAEIDEDMVGDAMQYRGLEGEEPTYGDIMMKYGRIVG